LGHPVHTYCRPICMYVLYMPHLTFNLMAMDPNIKVLDLHLVVADPRLEVVDLKQEEPERRSGGIRPKLSPAYTYTYT